VFKGAPIRELNLGGTRVANLRPLEELALTKLDLRETPVTDLTALRAPKLSKSLREVYLWQAQVTDFSPLAACTNLEVLDASTTALADLSIVRGRKLRVLHLINTKVTDISMLAGMPLTRVLLRGTAVTDLSPLLQCPTLAELVLPTGARNVGALRALPALTAISYESKWGGLPSQRASEFWKEYDAK
jgi:Leucine-rich repeat (LRR) protein